MPSYAATVDIAAPPEVVYDRVADLQRHGEWSADPLELTPAADGGFRSKTVAKGKMIEAELTVLERTPPSRFVFEAADLTGRWRHTFTLSPSGGGTRVRREISGDLKGGQLLLYWVVVLPIKKPNAAKALRLLKASVEAS
jgi:uncharacterized protein YndB with AHSA1/START domain